LITLPAIKPSRALSILIVDSFREGADSLTDLLRIVGYDAEVAYAEDALCVPSTDVVILELQLVGTDGWELVRQMRKVAKQFYAAVTSCLSPEDRRRSKDAGIDLHLAKPVKPAVLINVLKSLRRQFRPLAVK
jgi:two-component system, OmpR family, response regulator